MATIATPMLGRNKTASVKMSVSSRSTRSKANGNILNFFKKSQSIGPLETSPRVTDSTEEEEESLFIGENFDAADEPYQNSTPSKDEGFKPLESNAVTFTRDANERYNENEGSSKRRRIDDLGSRSPSLVATRDEQPPSLKPSPSPVTTGCEGDIKTKLSKGVLCASDSNMESTEDEDLIAYGSPPSRFPAIPTLTQEQTSVSERMDFDSIDEFAEEEFYEEGEEFLERKWMEEQAQLEADFEGDDGHEGLGDKNIKPNDNPRSEEGNIPHLDTEVAPSCPICSVKLVGITDQEASVHVNNCLDGKPTPLPSKHSSVKPKEPPALKTEGSGMSYKRFQRSGIVRPGQQNPFTFGSSSATTSVGSSSAFSTLMSGHAEDAAWAAAAANEAASRGKPAYQRICPFYKIMPGLFICVDAFRYGAVEGCKAYFLSHFHSDHYIGLTPSWCHGPIYCSRVTANLVRQQLRVDPKWVFDLEFDQTTEVPNTQGVRVTMIPANHCPGSSLFLFEKTIGKGKTPKVQRILHCGDFRACPAHVQHPLLRPNIVDLVSKRNIGQQKLDVCYLDTTYLTPKYAFPTQEDVIQACADMCVSLSKDFVDENDSWEQTIKERAGSGMVKFVRQASSNVKQEPLGEGDETEDIKPKNRGRLLVICGTYSIGKERICLGIAKALNSKIYAPPNKQRIVAALEDPELDARMTSDPLEAQVHMQMLMEIRAETLADYLTGYKPHFSRVVGFRPSGWNYRPPNSRFTESPLVSTVLNSDNWKSRYSMAELVPQRGSTRESSCFGVPYSEHSSFRELTMFCCALRIDKIVPTVNVGSAKSRERMKGWCEKWAAEKKKNGLWKIEDGQVAW